MNEQLKLLIELQAADDRIGLLECKLARIPGEIEKLRRAWECELVELGESKASLEEAGRERRAAERELEAHEQKIKKLKEQQFMVKTNKEYQTMVHEIAAEEEKKDAFEDKVLALLEKAAEGEKNIKAREQKLAAEKARHEAEERKLLEEQEGLEREAAAARSLREGVVKGVEKANLRLYAKLREFHRGKAVVPVLEGICQGCHIGLRPQKYQEVKTNENVLSCDECKRIIYYLEVRSEGEPAPAAQA